MDPWIDDLEHSGHEAAHPVRTARQLRDDGGREDQPTAKAAGAARADSKAEHGDQAGDYQG